MTTATATTYRERAEERRDLDDSNHAGELFTLAAYEYLGDCEYPEGRGLSSATALGDAIYCLQSAAVAFRRADRVERAESRCRQGILILEDVREHVSSYRAIDGVLTECLADFQVLASIDDPDATYDEAVTYYDGVSEPERWQSEPIFQSTIHVLVSLAAEGDEPIPESTQLDVMHSFEDRVELKRDRLPRVLDALSD